MSLNNNIKKTISAGGVVRKIIDNKVYIVLTRDSDKHDWVLPKGHIEKGETIEQAAVREIREETGLKDMKLIQKLGVNNRFSFDKNEYKTIHYFLFDCQDDRKLEKVKDEGKILEPKWFLIDDLPKLFWQEQRNLIAENLKIIKNSRNKKHTKLKIF